MLSVQSGGPSTPHAKSWEKSLGTHGTCRGVEPSLGKAAATESMMRGRTHTWVNGIGFVPSGAYQLPLVDAPTRAHRKPGAVASSRDLPVAMGKHTIEPIDPGACVGQVW
jgi:hypothetical protein